ncbi:hypothetical protein NP233_g7315 [Leucocoprinus birnbaumii]|uniref:Uncharacterized protein n=1 Tax=Leucocoprinus birnbaumii TaxID=56174 RepID=A0AAD5YUQ7_9AGAR|nr:hypothetical protein NP233_g7315 [Leucocoprinus birnbaumii]
MSTTIEPSETGDFPANPRDAGLHESVWSWRSDLIIPYLSVLDTLREEAALNSQAEESLPEAKSEVKDRIFRALRRGIDRSEPKQGSYRDRHPRCHPETRKELRAWIIDWLENLSLRNSPALYLYGPTGVGKLVILHSIARY